MDRNTLLIVIVAVIGIAAALGLILYAVSRNKRRSRHLKGRFGPEYERLVAETGSARRAEAQLAGREARVARFHIVELPPDERARYAGAWGQAQMEFVDNPRDALAHADALLAEVMEKRGYPVQDFEQRAADLSVDHPIVVQNYRAAHEIALKHKTGRATTEEMRQAMKHYRALFGELIADPQLARAHAV